MSEASVFDIEAAIDTAPIGAYQWLIIAICALIVMLDGFDTQAAAFIAPVLIRDWGLEAAQLGPIFGVGLAGGLLGVFLAGPFNSLTARRPLIWSSMLLFSATSLASAQAGDVRELIVLRFVTGFGLGIAIPNLVSMAAEYAPARRRTLVVAIVSCFYPVGGAIGALIAAPLMAAHGWRAVFILGGCAPLLLLPLALFVLPESCAQLVMAGKPADRIRTILRRIGIDPGAAVGFFIPDRTRDGASFRALFKDAPLSRTLLLWLTSYLGIQLVYILINWTPTLLKEGGLPLDIAVKSATALNSGAVLASLTMGYLIDRIGPFRIIGGAFLLGAPFIALIGLAGAPVFVTLGCVFLAGFLSGGAQLSVANLAANSYSTNLRSTGLGWCLAFGRIGAVAGPLAVGALLSAGLTSGHLFYLAAATSLLASGIIAIMGRLAR